MAEFKAALRKKLSREGEALPDGSFPIRNEKDLKNAISSYGRSKDPEKPKRGSNNAPRLWDWRN